MSLSINLMILRMSFRRRGCPRPKMNWLPHRDSRSTVRTALCMEYSTSGIVIGIGVRGKSYLFSDLICITRIITSKICFLFLFHKRDFASCQSERKQFRFIRIWWVIVFVISIYGCVVLIMNVWDKWEENPVMVSFAQTPTSIWDIPFPAVTICSETKIKKSVFNYEEALKKIHNKKTKFPSDLTLDE